METIKAYTREDFTDFYIGDKLLVTGYCSSDNQFVIESVLKFDFKECDICLKPLYCNKCIMQHDNRAYRLSNLWRVVHKRGTRIFLEQNNYVISIYARKDDFYYDKVKSACVDDIFLVNGWQTETDLIVKRIVKC